MCSKNIQRNTVFPLAVGSTAELGVVGFVFILFSPTAQSDVLTREVNMLVISSVYFVYLWLVQIEKVVTILQICFVTFVDSIC